ncbi:MAG: LytTR family DNA-binding domain-containing protein [Faecousia sp.]
MIFKLVIDKEKEEQIVATVHRRSALTDEIEALVAGAEQVDELTGYTEEDTVILKPEQIECICVEDGKTFAVYADAVKYRLRGRLYEVEARLGPGFVRINKSALANWKKIRRFKASIAGAVDVEFKSGHVEYVSRRCFAELKRRFDL